MADFFSLPIGGYGAKPNPWLKSESGRPIYETPLGVSFEIQPQPTQQDVYARSLADALAQGLQGNPFYGPAQAEMDVQRQGAEAALGGILPGLLDGVLQGVEAPGRAALGEPVTYGDVWSTALDYGALAAPAGKPAGALGAGQMRGYHGSPNKNITEFRTRSPSGRFSQPAFFAIDEPGSDWARQYADGYNYDPKTGKELAGRTYEVNIPANPKILDARIPEERANLIAALDASDRIGEGGEAFLSNQSVRGSQLPSWGDDRLFNVLDDAGYDGVLLQERPVSYVGADDGLVSAAIFNPKVVEIVRKYGIAGAAAMLGISAAELQAQMGGASAAPSADDLRSYLNELN